MKEILHRWLMAYMSGAGLILYGGKGSPAPPDYAGAAREQATSSKEVNTAQTWANRPNINTPVGQQTWSSGSSIDPSTGQPVTAWTQNTTLTPEMQDALSAQQRIGQGRSNAAEGLLGQATEGFNKKFNWEGAPGAGSMGDYDPNKARDRAEQALYQRQVNRIEPMLTQSEGERRTRLANMGVSPEGGSEAWTRAQTSMDANRGTQYENAALNAISTGGAEAQRELSLRAGGAQEMDRQRQSYVAEEAQRRGMTLNELNALLTGQQVNMPAFPGAPTSTAGSAQALQALNAAGMQGQFTSANKAPGMDWGSAIGGVASAAGAFAASDRRLKKNIKPLGDGWYEYEYVWGGGRRIGMMAQELMLSRPELVVSHPSGYLMINYGGL